MLLTITLLQLANITLVGVLLFIGFRFIEMNWSYKISKPKFWEEAVKGKKISKRLRGIERYYRDKVRFYNFWFQINRLQKESIPGAFAEVGVYKGETAKIIHAMDDSRVFHLFDTFEGFDKRDLAVESSTAPDHSIDFSDTTVESVASFIDGNTNIVIHSGYFPGTASTIQETNYALVHLDADLYQPTLAGLHYFYRRLSPGGVIIIHDYNHNWEGVTKAVDEFVKIIPESLIELTDWQGSVMIVKNKS
ncbi:hypothetical protein BH09BAC3_BH09BAC3_18570 [soil metagenome]